MCYLSLFHSEDLEFKYNHNKHSDFMHLINLFKGHMKRSKIKYDAITYNLIIFASLKYFRDLTYLIPTGKVFDFIQI